MGFPSSGKHRCLRGKGPTLPDSVFSVILGENTSISVEVSGRKLNGSFGGAQIIGNGDYTYTYVQGASSWLRTAMSGEFLTGFEPPATLLSGLSSESIFSTVYDPKGLCQGKVFIDTTGTTVDTVRFKYKDHRDSWKMNGRVEALTIIINQEVGEEPIDVDALYASIENIDVEAADGLKYVFENEIFSYYDLYYFMGGMDLAGWIQSLSDMGATVSDTVTAEMTAIWEAIAASGADPAALDGALPDNYVPTTLGDLTADWCGNNI